MGRAATRVESHQWPSGSYVWVQVIRAGPSGAPQLRAGAGPEGTAGYMRDANNCQGRIGRNAFRVRSRADSGAAYFTGYGAGASEAWSALTRTLSRRVVSDADRTAALDGATEFFEALSDWLSLP